MNLGLIIYLIINSLMAGYYLREAKDYKYKIPAMILIMLSGIYLVVIALLEVYIIQPLNTILQLDFFFNWYVLRKRDYTQEQIEFYNKVVKGLTKNTIRHMISRRLLKIVNKYYKYDQGKV